MVESSWIKKKNQITLFVLTHTEFTLNECVVI